MPKKLKPSKSTSDFSADRPIVSTNADRLGRKAFAEGLAERIRSWNGRDSLVIALCGEWGCGKTSLKNMVIENLKRGRSKKVDLLEFDPWEISGRDSLAASFFSELALVLAKERGDAPASNESAQRLDVYAKRATFGSKAIKTVAKTLSMFGAGAVGVPLDAVGDALNQYAEVAQQGSEAQKAADAAKNLSLAELKRSIASDMAALKRPVLIVIDDIDRLTTDEIREVFQLVKANANFPNLIYLLMFDREIVSGALDSISGGRGHEFLDKIVQVLFHVPQPPIKSVQQVLFDGLNVHLVDSGVGERWENSRWGNVWSGALSNYFTNLRCVYRFLGSFGFHVAQMRSGTSFEVNPLDLAVLETLRLFEPTLYEALPASKNMLVGGGHWTAYLNEDETAKRHKAEIDRLLSLASEDHRESLRDVLSELFPALFGRENIDSDALVRQLRVGHESLFDRYFTLALAGDDVSQADLDALRGNFTKPDAFARICASLNERGQLEAAFERLDAYKQSLPKGVFPNLIISLIDVGDSLPEKDARDFDTPSTRDCARRLIRFGLKAIKTQEERFAHLQTGLADSRGVHLAVKIVHMEQRNPDTSPDEYLVTEEQGAALKPIALERIRTAARDGRLKAMRGLLDLLWRWQEWAGEQEVRDWVSAEVQDSEGALWVLRTFLNISRRESDKVTFVRYQNLGTLARFTNIETLTTLTKDLDLAKLQQDDIRALRAFQQALIWKAEGKPDGYNGDTMRGENPLAEES